MSVELQDRTSGASAGEPANEPLWWVEGWHVSAPRNGQLTPIVRGVDLSVSRGECLALVGESGSGKTITTMSSIGLSSIPGLQTSGTVYFAGKELGKLDDKARDRHRSRNAGVVFQDHLSSLNPVRTIGSQLIDALASRNKMSRRVCQGEAVELLAKVGLPKPSRQMTSYPFELSGGMRQRVMIAIALAGNPPLLLADEPTTALDVTVQAQIIELVDELRSSLGLTVIWITHDLGVVARIADRVAVMYAGKIVETAGAKEFFAQPQHPYSKALLGASPRRSQAGRSRLDALPGQPPDPSELASLGAGCAFHKRCPLQASGCRETEGPLVDQGHGHWVAGICARNGEG